MNRCDFLATSASAALLAMMNVHEVLAAEPLSREHHSKKPLIHSLRLLTTSPLSDLSRFYGKVLGLPFSTNDKSLTIRAGQSTITFTKVEAVERPFYHFAFNIPENKIEMAFAWQRSRTPIIHPNPDGPRDAITHFRHWNAHSIFFLDPAGNLVEYIARHDLQNRTEGEFSINDLQYVSEIGFIVDDTEETGATIKKSLNLDSYRPSENFMPIGDEYGLLLMIHTGRVWSANPNQSNKVGVFSTSVSINGGSDWKSARYPYEILKHK